MSTIGHPHKDYALVHQIVEDAICAALKAAIPGKLLKNVDKAAREAIEKKVLENILFIELAMD